MSKSNGDDEENRFQRMRDEMKDWEMDQVNRYLKGEHIHYKRGRYERQHVAACLTNAIETACGIHAKGISSVRFT